MGREHGRGCRLVVLAYSKLVDGYSAAKVEPAPAAGLKRAVLWALALNGGRLTTSTLVVFILAALLGPSAFGTVAVASIYVIFLQLSFQQGLAPAVIHRETLDENVLNVAFRLALFGSLILMLFSFAVSEPLGNLFEDEALPEVVRALSLLLPILAIDLVPEALTRRKSGFRLLAFRANASVIVGGIIGVIAAFAGAGVWALVLQQLLTATLSTVLLYARTDWRPRLRGPGIWRGRQLCRELLAYSMPASAAATSQALAQSIDTLLAGLFFGPRVAGLYRLAGRLTQTVFDVGVRSGQAATFPDLVRRRYDAPDAFRERLLRIHKASAISTMPIFGILAGAAWVLPPLLGEAWRPASLPLLLLALTGLVSVASSTVLPVLQAMARPGLLALINAAELICTTAAVLAVGFAGQAWPVVTQLTAVAAARLIVVLSILTPLSLEALRQTAGVSVGSSLRASLPGFCAAAVAASSGLILTSTVPSTWGPWPIAFVVMACSSSAALLSLVLSERHMVLARLRGRR